MLFDHSKARAELDQVRKRNAQLIQLANKKFKEKNYQASAAAWKVLLKEDPNNSKYLFNLGSTLYIFKKYKEASKYFVNAIRQGGDLGLISRIYLSRCFYNLGKEKEAILLLNSLLNLKLPDSVYNLLLDELEKHAPKEEQYYEQATNHLKENDLKEAFYYFKLAWILNPSSINYFMLGYSQLKMGDKDKARSYFMGIKDNEIYNDAMALLKEKEQDAELQDEQDIIETIEGDNIRGPKSFSFYIDYAQGKNSNPNTQAESEDFEADTELVGSTGLSYTFFSNDDAIAKISLDGFIDEFENDPTTKSTGYSISLPIDVYQRRYTINLIPKYEITFYGDDPYVNNSSLAIYYKYFEDKGSFNWSYTVTGYKAEEFDFSYLDGEGQFMTLGYSKGLGRGEVTVDLQYQNEDLEDSDDTIGSKNAYGLEFSIYFPFLYNRLSLSPTINYTKHFYKADSSGFEQEDTTLTTSLFFNIIINNSLSIYYSGRYIDNESNLNNDSLNNNYEQTFNSFGFSWTKSF